MAEELNVTISFKAAFYPERTPDMSREEILASYAKFILADWLEIAKTAQHVTVSVEDVIT